MSLRKLRWIIGALFRRHRRLSLVILLAVVGLALVYRYTSSQNLPQTVVSLLSKAEYSEGLVGTPQTLNPLFVAADSERDISSLIFRGLTKTNISGETIPDLAERWEVSSNSQVYLFHLKPNQFFQDGTPVTAEDVAFTYELAKNPETGSRFSETFKDLEIQVVGTDSVLFRLAQPFSPFLTLTDLGILPRAALAETEPRNLRLAKFNLQPVGSSPFRLKSISKEEAILVNGQTEYSFRFYSSASDLEVALKMGEVKAAGFTEAIDFSGWKNLQVLSSPLYRRFTGVFYNLRGSPTAEKNVRQGLSYAIDKNKIIKELLNEAAEPVSSSIAPISWAKADNPRQYDFRLDSAKSSLDRSGWRGGPIRQKEGKSLDITVSFIDTPVFKKIAEQVASDWAQAGVRAILNPLSAADFATKVVANKDFHAAIFTQEVGVDPDQYSLWHTTQAFSTNITGLRLPILDKALEDGRSTISQEERKAKYADFQRFLIDEAPVTLLYYPKYSFVVSTKIQDINLKPLGVPADRLNEISSWDITRTFF